MQKRPQFFHGRRVPLRKFQRSFRVDKVTEIPGWQLNDVPSDQRVAPLLSSPAQRHNGLWSFVRLYASQRTFRTVVNTTDTLELAVGFESETFCTENVIRGRAMSLWMTDVMADRAAYYGIEDAKILPRFRKK